MRRRGRSRNPWFRGLDEMPGRRFFYGWFALCALLAVSGLGFTVWVILKVMAHFGIL